MVSIEDLPHGTAGGQFIFVNQDNADAGTSPNAVLVTGTVRFTCTATPPIRSNTLNVGVVPLVHEAVFDSEGWLIPLVSGQATPTVVPGQVERGLELLATNSQLLNPTDFRWIVSFHLVEALTGRAINIPSFPIEVPEGQYVSLPPNIPMTDSNGVLITRGEPGPRGPQGEVGNLPEGGTATDYLTGVGWKPISELPLSTAMQDALSGRAPLTHTHTRAQIADASVLGRHLLGVDEPAAARAAIGAKAETWVPDYNEITGRVPTAALPPLAVVETTPVTTEADMLALSAQRGDIAIRMDVNKTFILASEPATELDNWKEIMAAGQVLSVAGKSGTVSLTRADVGLDAVDNTADVDKPVSLATEERILSATQEVRDDLRENIFDRQAPGMSTSSEPHPRGWQAYWTRGTEPVGIGQTQVKNPETGESEDYFAFDPKRHYLLSFDAKASLADSKILFQMSYRTADLTAKAASQPYVFIDETLSTEWRRHSKLIGPLGPVVPPTDTRYVSPVMYPNRPAGTQGATQYFANFRLVDVTDVVDAIEGHKGVSTGSRRMSLLTFAHDPVNRHVMQWQDIVSSPDLSYSNGVFTVKRAGRYEASLAVSLQAASDVPSGNYADISLRANGNLMGAHRFAPPRYLASQALGPVKWSLNVGDTISAELLNNTSVVVTATSTLGYCRIDIARIGPAY